MNTKSAFTLVELAIVIVIIGLLVGGVLQGQELIKQAKWRSAMKEIEGYRGAMATFFGKYNCIPGDCPNGFRFFGSDCGTNAPTVASNGNMGCNGDGNKTLTYAEGQLLWKHLSLGKMIKGSFTEGYSSSIKTNVNIPSNSISNNAGISAFYAQGLVNSSTSCGYEFCTDGGSVRGGIPGRNVFNVGNSDGTTYIIRGGVLTPMEAYEFDVKFDDGLYHSGAISGFYATLLNGNTSFCGDNTTRTYFNTQPTYMNVVGCRMIFDSGF